MRRRSRLLACILLAWALAQTPAALLAAAAPLRYEVSVASVADRRFRVAVTVDPEGARSVLFAIPAWSPGYYQILRFQQDISRFHAVDGAGRSLMVKSLDPRTWEVRAGKGPVTATYEVTAGEAGFGFFASHLDDETGYINGASALMYVVGAKDRPAALAVRVPAGWKVACPLDPTGPDTFRAADYDDLIDAPIQVGKLEKVDFPVRGVPFSAILVGQTLVDRAQLASMLTRVSAAAFDIFGYAPFRRYYYVIHCAVGSFGGGLEHRNSTVLNVWGLPGRDPKPWMTLAAHEYFHAWNVKRLRPSVLGPFDYTQKVRTGSLWFAEGVTDYYSLVLPRIAGLMSTQEFLDDLAGRIGQLQRTDARKTVSAEDASRKSWEGGSMGYGGLSYYLKGSLLGLVFDIEIRSATGGRKNLDDVMRLLDEQYGKRNVGYDEDALLRAINQVSGRDLSDIYRRYVRSTEEIPWNSILSLAGLVYREGAEKQPYVGVATGPGPRGVVRVEDVIHDTPASAAGILEGDQIVTVNGTRVPWERWEAHLLALRPGQQVTLGVRRGGRALEIPLKLGSRDRPLRRIQPIDDAAAAARQVCSGLLREHPADAATPVAGGAR